MACCCGVEGGQGPRSDGAVLIRVIFHRRLQDFVFGIYTAFLGLYLDAHVRCFSFFLGILDDANLMFGALFLLYYTISRTTRRFRSHNQPNPIQSNTI